MFTCSSSWMLQGKKKEEVLLLSNQDTREEDASPFLSPEGNQRKLRRLSLIG